MSLLLVPCLLHQAKGAQIHIDPFRLNLRKVRKPDGFPGGSVLTKLPANAGATEDASSIPGWGRFPRRRKWQPTPVFSPGESHGQRSLGGLQSMGLQRVRRSWAHTHTQEGQQGPVCFDLYALQIHWVPGLPPDTLYNCVAYFSQFRTLSFRELTLPPSHHQGAVCLEHGTQGGWTLGEQRLHLHQLPWAEMSHPGYRGGSAVLAAPPCPAQGGGGRLRSLPAYGWSRRKEGRGCRWHHPQGLRVGSWHQPVRKKESIFKTA